MSEIFKSILTWLTTSGIKIVGILISLIILSQMSRWIVKWLEKFVPKTVGSGEGITEKD